MKYFVLFSGFLFCIVAFGQCVLHHTNIGKFVDGIFAEIQSGSLKISAHPKLDRKVLEEAFEGFRNLIDDPMDIMEQNLDYKMENVTRVRGYVRNLQVRYLKNMILDYLHLSEDNLNSESIIRMPLLEISGLYNTSVYLNHYDIDIYGNGSFKWQISDFKLKMNLSLARTKTGFMQLQKVNIDQSMNGSKFEIKNLLNDEAVSNAISDVVSIVIPPLHNYFKPVINELVVRLVALNSEVLFSNIKYEQFVGILYAFAEKAKSNNSSAT